MLLNIRSTLIEQAKQEYLNMIRKKAIFFRLILLFTSIFHTFGLELNLFPPVPDAKPDITLDNLTDLFKQHGNGFNMAEHNARQLQEALSHRCQIAHGDIHYNVTQADRFMQCLCEIEDAGTHACRIEMDSLLDGLPFAFASFAKLAINVDQHVVFSIWTRKAYYCKAQLDGPTMSMMCYRNFNQPGADKCKTPTYLCELANCLRASVHENHIMKAIFLACVKDATIRMSHLINDPFHHVRTTTPKNSPPEQEMASKILLIEALVGGLVGGVIFMTILICIAKMCRDRFVQRRNSVERRPKSATPSVKSVPNNDTQSKRESNIYDVLDETGMSSRQTTVRAGANHVPDVLDTVPSKERRNSRTDYSILKETGDSSADSDEYNRLRNLSTFGAAYHGVYKNDLAKNNVSTGIVPTDDYDHILPETTSSYSPAPLTPPRKFSQSIIDLDSDTVEYSKVEKKKNIKKSPKPKPRLQIKETSHLPSESVTTIPNYFVLEPQTEQPPTD